MHGRLISLKIQPNTQRILPEITSKWEAKETRSNCSDEKTFILP